MAFFGNLPEFGADIVSGISGGIFTGLLIGGLAAFLYYYFRIKKYNYVVRVYEKDKEGNTIEKDTDKGGIFIDKTTQYRLFVLKKYKVGLTPDKVPYMLKIQGNKVFRVVNVLQTGLKNFQYLNKPSIALNPGITFDVQDEDIAWALNAWEKFRLPSKHALLEKLIPHLAIAITGVFVIAIIYVMFKEGGFNADLIRQLADAATKISDNLAKASLGTTVVE